MGGQFSLGGAAPVTNAVRCPTCWGHYGFHTDFPLAVLSGLQPAKLKKPARLNDFYYPSFKPDNGLVVSCLHGFDGQIGKALMLWNFGFEFTRAKPWQLMLNLQPAVALAIPVKSVIKIFFILFKSMRYFCLGCPSYKPQFPQSEPQIQILPKRQMEVPRSAHWR